MNDEQLRCEKINKDGELLSQFMHRAAAAQFYDMDHCVNTGRNHNSRLVQYKTQSDNRLLL